MMIFWSRTHPRKHQPPHFEPLPKITPHINSWCNGASRGWHHCVFAPFTEEGKWQSRGCHTCWQGECAQCALLTLKSVFYQRTQEQVPYSLKHLICMHQVTLSESSKFKRRSSEAHIAHVCGGVCPRWEERIESVLSSAYVMMIEP